MLRPMVLLLIAALLLSATVSLAAVESRTAPHVIEGEVLSIDNEMRQDKKFYYRFQMRVVSEKSRLLPQGKVIDGYIPVRAMDLLAADQARMVGTIVLVELSPEDNQNKTFLINKIKVLR